MSTPPIHLGARQTHKGGEQPRDCQDAWWAGAHPPRVAVADGATKAFFAREWAWLLAEHFCADGGGMAAALLGADGPDGWRGPLAAVRGAWHDAVRQAIGQSRTRALLENRLQRRDPAAATFAGVALGEGGAWRAVLIGDSCLLRFSAAGAFLGSEPLDGPEQFGNHPEALLSIAGSPRETPPRVAAGTDDVLVLATDAAARWLLSFPPAGRFAGVRYLLGEAEDGFDARVAAARRGAYPGAPAMEDDDVTLVVVSLRGPLPGTRPLAGAAVPPPLSPAALGPAEPDADPGPPPQPSLFPPPPSRVAAGIPPAPPPAAAAPRETAAPGAMTEEEAGGRIVVPISAHLLSPQESDPPPAPKPGRIEMPAFVPPGEAPGRGRRAWRVLSAPRVVIDRVARLGERRLAALLLASWIGFFASAGIEAVMSSPTEREQAQTSTEQQKSTDSLQTASSGAARADSGSEK